MDYRDRITNEESAGQMSIGGSNWRIDSLGKVTSRTRCVEDIVIPGMLHACVQRSPHRFAKLLSIDTADASQASEIVRIITASDIPGTNELVGYSRGDPVPTSVGIRCGSKAPQSP